MRKTAANTAATDLTAPSRGGEVAKLSNLSLVHNPRELVALIDGRSLIYKIGDLTDWLVAGMMPVAELPNPDDPDDPNLSADFTLNPTSLPVARWEKIQKDDVPRLKAAIEANFKLLNKVMPDLKSVEFTDNTPRRPLNDMELATRLAAVMTATNNQLAPPCANPTNPPPQVQPEPIPLPTYTQTTYEPLADRPKTTPPPLDADTLSRIEEALQRDEALAHAKDELAQMRRAIYAQHPQLMQEGAPQA